MVGSVAISCEVMVVEVEFWIGFSASPEITKLATTDSMENIRNYKYVVALPAPSLYAQANNLDDVNIVLSALKEMGFDDVFEVSAAAEVVSLLSRKYIDEHKDKWPIISTACPSIVRLIRVRFPNLLEHLMPIKPPMEIAAEMARKRAMEKTGLSSEDIGIFFLSPCPAKVTSVKSPIGYEKSNVDQVVAIKDIYPKLISAMTHVVEENKVEELSESGRIGIGWGRIGGEAAGLLTDSYLAADGIENVIKVLEDLEDSKCDGLPCRRVLDGERLGGAWLFHESPAERTSWHVRQEPGPQGDAEGAVRLYL